MYSIVLIEDDMTTRKALTGILTRQGFHVVSAPTYQEGLRQCRTLRPDAVVSDVQLPDGNGIDLPGALAADPALQKIPVVLMSGEKISAENRIKGLDRGADDYMLKPVRGAELATRLRRLLRALPS